MIESEYPHTIPGLLEHAQTKCPDRPYLQVRRGEQVRSWTFSQIHAWVESTAAKLIASGIGHGDHVALLVENRPEWVIHYLAITSLGAVVVPLDPLIPVHEISNILEMSDSRALITSEKFRGSLEHFANVDALSVELDLDQSAPDCAEGKTGFPEISPSDVAAIIYTSGTMGVAKGVVLTHENLCSNVHGVLRAITILPTDNFHLLLPLHHAYSSTVNMLVPLGGGACATFATSYKSRDIVDDIRIGRITLLVGVPQLFENMMGSINRAVTDTGVLRQRLFRILSAISRASAAVKIETGKWLFRSLRRKAGMNSLRFLISGGAALPTTVARYFQTLGFWMLQGYGLTETSPILCVNRPERNRIGSVGPAIDRVELRIADPDPATGIGEICARGPGVMQGYYKNAEITSSVIRDGWLHTGDAGYLDRDGYLFITGRIKNVIITGAGKNVFPEEIEARLNSNPYVLESIVIGVTRKRGSGEELCAILVPDKAALEAEAQSGHYIDIEKEIGSLIQTYNGSVPQFRWIRQWRIRSEEFEKTSTRKIKRYLYKNEFKSAWLHHYASD